jgi:hypothetical protein
VNALLYSLSDAVSQVGQLWNTVATFLHDHPSLGAVLLTVLVCAVGWEATHPQEEGKHHA